jgi:4-amino-4-deoxy-L-arabinose transferase-like glycosyltransferase
VLLPLALLPIGAIALASYALRPAGHAVAPVRLALIRAGVLIGGLTVVSVEALGALDALTLPIVAIAWSVGCAIALIAALLRWRRDDRPSLIPLPRLRATWRSAGPFERVLALVLIALLLGELLVALLSPPNNFDSMTYHLPKIEHWAANHNVGFFATRIHRQNTFSPGAEYLLLQLRLLTGGSTWYNLVQWTAGLGCVLAASRVAGQLGGSRRAQLLTGFVLGTTPMVALEASSTQTDLVVAAWVAALATLVLDDLRRRTSVSTVLLLGTATGLIALTKATGLLGAAALLLLWGVAQLRLAHCAQLRTIVRRVAVTGAATVALLLVALVIAGPYLHRSDETFGNPLGPDYSRDSISMQRHDPASVTVNGLRVLHTLFDTPVTPLHNASAHAVTSVAHALNVNVNDPKITFVGTAFPFVAWRPDEDSVSYPVQAALILVGAAVVLIRPRRVVGAPDAVPARVYAAAFWLAVLLYAVVIKWQPWGNRLILFALVMGAPTAGLWLDAVLRRASERAAGNAQAPRRRRAAAWVVVLALGCGAAAGWLAVGYGWPRRLVGHGSVFTTHGADAMFNRRPQWLPDYEYVADGVRASGAKRVGLAQDANTWEYPWWYLLPGTDIEALQSLVPNHPAYAADGMDAVICVIPQPDCAAAYVPPGWTLHWHGTAGYALPPAR